MYRLNFLFSLLFIGLGLNGQVLIGDPETAFAYKVKQIDEFINRFNHSPYTLILRQNPHLTHRADLYTLFNQEEDNWDYALLEEFVEETLTLSGQRILDFYDSGWYAELNCTFFYQGSPREITLVLQNQVTPNQGSKWVIVSVLQPMKEIFCKDIPKAKSNKHYLHPMSHVTNFMELERAFEDRDNLQNFFDTWNQGMDFLAFKNGVMNGTLKHQSNLQVTYHFLQLEKWIFTVDYFPRQHLNSGWLISSLRKASDKEKKRYMAEKLNLL